MGESSCNFPERGLVIKRDCTGYCGDNNYSQDKLQFFNKALFLLGRKERCKTFLFYRKEGPLIVNLLQIKLQCGFKIIAYFSYPEKYFS